MRTAKLAALALLAGRWVAPADAADNPGRDAFVEEARAATAKYQDRLGDRRRLSADR